MTVIQTFPSIFTVLDRSFPPRSDKNDRILALSACFYCPILLVSSVFRQEQQYFRDFHPFVLSSSAFFLFLPPPTTVFSDISPFFTVPPLSFPLLPCVNDSILGLSTCFYCLVAPTEKSKTASLSAALNEGEHPACPKARVCTVAICDSQQWATGRALGCDGRILVRSDQRSGLLFSWGHGEKSSLRSGLLFSWGHGKKSSLRSGLLFSWGTRREKQFAKRTAFFVGTRREKQSARCKKRGDLRSPRQRFRSGSSEPPAISSSDMHL